MRQHLNNCRNCTIPNIAKLNLAARHWVIARSAILNRQPLAILESWQLTMPPRLAFTFMLAGISPSNFFTARAAEGLPMRWSSGRKTQKNKHLLPVQQRRTLASQLLYHELE
jgi:hypothetical protein